MSDVENKDRSNDKLLSTKEAAAFLGMTEKAFSMRRFKKINTVPFIKVGKNYKYWLSDIKSFDRVRKRFARRSLGVSCHILDEDENAALDREVQAFIGKNTDRN